MNAKTIEWNRQLLAEHGGSKKNHGPVLVKPQDLEAFIAAAERCAALEENLVIARGWQKSKALIDKTLIAALEAKVPDLERLVRLASADGAGLYREMEGEQRWCIWESHETGESISYHGSGLLPTLPLAKETREEIDAALAPAKEPTPEAERT